VDVATTREESVGSRGLIQTLVVALTLGGLAVRSRSSS